jgi:hypothetical protein
MNSLHQGLCPHLPHAAHPVHRTARCPAEIFSEASRHCRCAGARRCGRRCAGPGRRCDRAARARRRRADAGEAPARLGRQRLSQAMPSWSRSGLGLSRVCCRVPQEGGDRRPGGMVGGARPADAVGVDGVERGAVRVHARGAGSRGGGAKSRDGPRGRHRGRRARVRAENGAHGRRRPQRIAPHDGEPPGRHDQRTDRGPAGRAPRPILRQVRGSVGRDRSPF